MPARSPEEVDALFEKALKAGDIEGLVALYEPDATLIPQPGQEAKGRDAIREALTPPLAGGARIDLKVERTVAIGRGPGRNVWRVDDEGRRPGAIREDHRNRPPAAGRTWLFVIGDPFVRGS